MEENNVVFSEQEVNDGKVFAILMLIIPILFILPLVMEDKKNNAYLKHYSNQELLMIIAGVAISIVCIIPIIGWIVGAVAGILVTISWFILLIGAINGTPSQMLIIGKIKILDK